MDYVKQKYDKPTSDALLARIDWVAWIQTPGGNPPNSGLDFNTPDGTEFSTMADTYINNGGEKSPDDIDNYKTTVISNLKVIFHSQLINRQNDLTTKILTKVDSDLNVTNDSNPEIGQRWFPLCISKNYQPCFSAAHAYVSKIGRQKYIIPVYQALVHSGYRNLAYQWFNENKSFYHPITTLRIKNLILNTVDFDQDSNPFEVEYEPMFLQ